VRDDLTVIYYTSNRERPRFENKIMRSLKHASGGLPIISVSQKPIDLGQNICVGEKPVSSQNAWRQLQVGAAEAKTKYIATAESDFIYPKEYFSFEPDRADTAYIAAPLYLCFNQRGIAKVFYLKPRGSEAAMIIGRDCLVDAIETTLKDVGMWGSAHADGRTIPYLLDLIGKREDFHTRVPTITFKTDSNMHRRSPHDPHSKCRELPYIGKSNDLIRRYT